ncbi:MAG TPA: LCP family protein [Acidimicrobiia bacterium]|nr:LCP family protein [Acidimicrobiia bacterium]
MFTPPANQGRAVPALVVAWAMLSACVVGGTVPAEPVTVSPRPTTTTTRAATTTTQPAFHLEGASPAWERAVADVYGSACGGNLQAIAPELAERDAASECPSGGRAAMSSVGDIELAAAEIGPDAIFGVGGGDGFQIVAARLTSMSPPETALAWYGVVPKVVLAVGSDARPGEDPRFSRADSIHLVALNGLGHGGVLGIPRDSWVRISGGGVGKINSSLSSGGPDVMLQTVADVTGLNLDGYVLTGFTGFQEMVGNVLGGVDIDLPFAVADSAAGADLGAGSQYLNGPDALALARARKSLPGGDLTRQFNGGLLLLAALSSAQSYGPLHLPTLISESVEWMNTDLAPGDLLSFAALALDTPIGRIGNHVAPGRVGTAGSASVVYLTDSAPSLFADLADGSLAP